MRLFDRIMAMMHLHPMPKAVVPDPVPGECWILNMKPEPENPFKPGDQRARVIVMAVRQGHVQYRFHGSTVSMMHPESCTITRFVDIYVREQPGFVEAHN